MTTTTYHIHATNGAKTATTTDPETAEMLSRAGLRVTAVTEADHA